MTKEDIASRTEEVLDEVGISDRRQDCVATLSKGMVRRLELAQTLFANPRLMILDEPFYGLDPVGRIEIRNLIMRYNREKGTTVFFSSHILSDVETMCDSIGILDKGVLKVVGQKDDLLGIESIEISSTPVDRNGMMFIEKFSDNISKTKDSLSVFISPGNSPSKIEKLLEKYGGKNIKVTKHYRDLEDFFTQTVDG